MTAVIKDLRRPLGDEPRQPRFIESVYGRGYAFIAPVLHEPSDFDQTGLACPLTP